MKKVSQKEAMITVTTTILGSQDTKHKRLKVRPFVTETATMGVKLGTTIPTGDYASARIDVSVFMPCYTEEAVSALEQCYSFADRFLSKKISQVTGKEEEVRLIKVKK